jgi:hypothetical protein
MLVMGQQVLNSQISWADKLVIAQQPQITQIFLGDNAGFQATNAESSNFGLSSWAKCDKCLSVKFHGLSSWL